MMTRLTVTLAAALCLVGCNQATDSLYGEYKSYDGLNFPSKIEIKRPQEEYDITLSVLKLQLNEPLGNEKFMIEQPSGAEVIHLNQVHTQIKGVDQASRLPLQ